MDKKTFNIKDGTVDLMLIAREEGSKDYIIVADSQGHQVGYCSFKLSRISADLNRIVVTAPQFLSRGVGHAMMFCMEQFCHNQRLSSIWGFYIPRVYDNANELTSKFYRRHGFIGDGYGEYFDREQIGEYVLDRGDEYLLTPVYDKDLYDRIYEYNYKTCDLFSTGPKEQSELEI